MKLEDKLALVKRKIDRESHIKVDQDKFRADAGKVVLYICPAKVYELNEESERRVRNKQQLRLGLPPGALPVQAVYDYGKRAVINEAYLHVCPEYTVFHAIKMHFHLLEEQL